MGTFNRAIDFSRNIDSTITVRRRRDGHETVRKGRHYRQTGLGLNLELQLGIGLGLGIRL